MEAKHQWIWERIWPTDQLITYDYWNTIHPIHLMPPSGRSGPPKVSQMPWFTSSAWNKWSWSWVAQVLTKAFAEKTCWTNKRFNNLNHSDSSCLFQSLLPLEHLEQEACLRLSFNYLRQHVASPSITHNKRFLLMKSFQLPENKTCGCVWK